MNEGLQIKSNCDIYSGGYAGEPHGVTDHTYDNFTDVPLSGSFTNNYYYTNADANRDPANNYCTVTINMTTSWTATRSLAEGTYNYITINVTTTVNSISMNKVGQGSGYPNAYTNFAMNARNGGPAGAVIWNGITSDDSLTSSSPSLPFTANTFTVILHPSTTYSTSTFYFKNWTDGVYLRANNQKIWDAGVDDNTPLPNMYIDAYGMGLQFKNTLSPDYRPGKHWNGSDWKSHDRNAGAARIYSGASISKEMRTNTGGVASDNPPFMQYSSSEYKNQRKIGSM